MGDSRCRPGVGGPRRAPGWAGLAAVALLLAGCDRGSDAAPPGATVREDTTPPTTATTTPADPYAVPEVIDAAYVDRVLAALYKVHGDAVRIIVREGDIAPEAAATLQAIYADDELHHQSQLWGAAVRQGLQGFRNPPGGVAVRVEELRTARPDCIFAVVKADFSATEVVASEPRTSYRALVPKPPDIDPGGLNPTPWVIALDAVSIDDAPPEDPC